MPRKNYNYLGEGNISIEAPTDILERAERNLEEEPNDNPETQGKVYVTKGEPVKIRKSDNYPYIWAKTNSSKNYEGVDFFRYNSHIQTIWKKNSKEYEVLTNQGVDCGGALKCFKKIYYGGKSSRNKSLIHGALLNIDEKGIFIVGQYRSGKSTLLMNLLEGFGGTLITGGNTLIGEGEDEISGFYLPRNIYLRFSSIVSSDKLRPTIYDQDSCEAIQPIDKEALDSIVRAKAFHVDAGLNYSRKKFSELMGIKNSPNSRIEKIIFIEYAEGSKPNLRSLSNKEALARLRKREFPINTSIGNIDHQTKIKPPKESLIEKNWLKYLDMNLLSYNGNKDLTKILLEDLVQ